MDTRTALAALLLAGLIAAPADAQRARTAPHPTDGEIAHWVADALSRGALRDHENAQDLFDRHGLRPDLDVAQEVRARIDKALDGALGHSVVSSHDGVVTLQGRVETDDDRARAGAIAAAVPGAHQVVNRIAVGDGAPPPAPVLADRRPDGPGAAGPVAFVTENLLGGRDVAVAVRDGVVTLTGTVSNADAGRHAANVARRVPGVRAVLDRTAVRGGSDEDDRRVQLIAFRRMQYEPLLHEVVREVDVVARDGVVRLAGTVRSEAEKLVAGALVADLRAVVAVDNRIVVDPTLIILERDYEVPGYGPFTTHLAGN